MYSGENSEQYTTVSGIPEKKIYRPWDIAALKYEEDLGDSEEPPYTRGVYPDMYRSKLWRLAQLTGSGKAEDSRERVKSFHQMGSMFYLILKDISMYMT